MKKLCYFILMLSVFVMSSCTKTSFELRVKNNLTEKIKYIEIGQAYFSSIYTGSTSSYESISEGTHQANGETESGMIIEGSVSLTATSDYAGKHSFTLAISSSGFSLTEN